jgi:ribonuclease HII
VLVVGVDENGLGPRLGPLVVTAVAVEADGERAAKVALGRPGRAFATRINDSKKLVSYKERALGEAWARVLAGAVAMPTSSPADLVFGLSLEPEAFLREPCPTDGDHAQQCFGAHGEAFEASAELLGQVRSDLVRLEKRGLRLVSVRVSMICTRRLNDAAARRTTRFQVDLHAMERLVLEARTKSGSDVVAVCGKVGGYDRYANAFGPLAGRLHAVVCEGRARSEYALPGLGRLAFVRDADARHLVVCLASLVGKYVRDLVTARVVRHHKRSLPHLPMVSGYHDPVTARFIADTDDVRRASGFPSDCFERRAVPSPFDDPGMRRPACGGSVDEPLEQDERELDVDDLAPASLVEPASRV